MTAAMKLKDAPWKKSYDKSRWHIIKQNHPLLTKVCIVKAMVFPVVIYGCESWTIKLSKDLEVIQLAIGVLGIRG